MKRLSYATSLLAAVALVVLVSRFVPAQVTNPIDPTRITTDLITTDPIISDRIADEAKERKARNRRVVWQYKIVPDGPEMESQLNQLEKDGWKLASVIQASGHGECTM